MLLSDTLPARCWEGHFSRTCSAFARPHRPPAASAAGERLVSGRPMMRVNSRINRRRRMTRPDLLSFSQSVRIHGRCIAILQLGSLVPFIEDTASDHQQIDLPRDQGMVVRICCPVHRLLAGRTHSAHRCRYMREGGFFRYGLSVGNCGPWCWCLIAVHLAMRSTRKCACSASVNSLP